MTENIIENIIENNELIAEFMEVQLLEFRGKTFNELKYDSDWNWLMPVVERIESMLHDDVVITIEYKDCVIPVIAGSFNTDNDGFDIRVNGNSKIQAVYKACIQFINWYNQNKN